MKGQFTEERRKALEMILSIPEGDTATFPFLKCVPATIRYYVQKTNREAGYARFSFREDRVRCEVRVTHNIRGEVRNGRDAGLMRKTRSLLSSLRTEETAPVPPSEYNITTLLNAIRRENRLAGYTAFSYRRGKDGCFVKRNRRPGDGMPFKKTPAV